MEKEMLQNAQPVPCIPPDVEEEILSRLPVKTLTTLKSACRSWNNLISDPQFSKLHLKQAIHDNRMKLMYMHDCVICLAYDARSGWVKRPFGYSNSICGGAGFLAHCHGLFCISNVAGDVFLCNPSTKQTRKIATSSIDFPTPCSTRASVFFGLGYHSPSDDYKLVRISLFNGSEFTMDVKIYSRNTGTWRRIDDFPYKFPLSSPGVFADGCLHWRVSMMDYERPFYRSCHRIALLDLASESYELIRLPEFRWGKRFFEIGSLGEKLAAFYSCHDWTVDIWVLKEHRRPESWTRITIATAGCFDKHELTHYFQPLCLLKPGHILLRLGAQKLVSYDVAEKRYSEIHTQHKLVDSRIQSFVESLVSPFAP